MTDFLSSKEIFKPLSGKVTINSLAGIFTYSPSKRKKGWRGNLLLTSTSNFILLPSTLSYPGWDKADGSKIKLDVEVKNEVVCS